MTARLTLFCLTLLCTCARAQEPLNFGEQYVLQSMILTEERPLNVLLPREYRDSSANRYPVFYLLDGAADEDFFHVAGLLRYYQDHNMMPPAILVGVGNTNRMQDMTYPSSDPRDKADFPTSGGAEAFVHFLQQELVPWSDTTFRTSGQRTLIGQSLAGLLAVEVMLKYPGYYDDYIIVSPSLWWDKEGLYRSFDSLVSELKVLPDRAYLSAGTEYPVMVDGSRKLAQLLSEKTGAIFQHLPAEDHNSILHEALNRALDQWYDPTKIRPYHYANARSGLMIRAEPNKGAAVIGKLLYGQALGILKREGIYPDTIDGLAGQWTYIGSNLGRGWVFDAWLAPVPVFKDSTELAAYAINVLGNTDEMIVRNAEAGKNGCVLKIYSGDGRAKFIERYYYEADEDELQLFGLTAAQALVVAQQFLIARETPCSLKYQEVWPGGFQLVPAVSNQSLPTGWSFLYAKNTLHLKRKGWFVRSPE